MPGMVREAFTRTQSHNRVLPWSSSVWLFEYYIVSFFLHTSTVHHSCSSNNNNQIRSQKYITLQNVKLLWFNIIKLFNVWGKLLNFECISVCFSYISWLSFLLLLIWLDFCELVMTYLLTYYLSFFLIVPSGWVVLQVHALSFAVQVICSSSLFSSLVYTGGEFNLIWDLHDWEKLSQ